MLRDHQQRLNIHPGLSVVALLEATACGGHDAGFLIGQVDLIAVFRAGRGRFGILASWLLTGFALGLTLGCLGLKVLLLDGVPLSRALLDLGLGLGNRTESIFTPGNLGRHIHAIGHGGTDAVLGQRQQLLDFLA